MNPLGTLVLPCSGSFPGVTELSAGACDAPDELDRLPAGDIYGRKELKPGSGTVGGGPSFGHSVATQFSSSWAPASPDFSGWN